MTEVILKKKSNYRFQLSRSEYLFVEFIFYHYQANIIEFWTADQTKLTLHSGYH